jgi:DNA-binding SARP family transcriptional activator/ABC-type branched-subunit amino acid transport system substrate-binding protein
MDFRLLGRLEVSDGDRIVQIGEGRQRSVLAILLLHHDQTVPSERIIDALWGEHPPPTAAKVLQNHVAQLRRALGDRPGALLQTHGHGYALHLDGGGFDLERFEELARGGSGAIDSGDYAEARTLLEEALALWRGPPLADFAYEAFAQPEIARLEERRLTAVEQRLEAELGLGHDHALVPELEGLVAEHPTRERLRAQLMLALYRAGRQADALTVYGQGRQALIDELGVEPGPALRDLQAAILRQDPSLVPAHGGWRVPGRRERVARRAPIALILTGGALLVGAAVAVALLAGGGGGSPTTATALLPDGDVGAIDPSSGAVLGSVRVPGEPDGIASSRGRAWAVSERTGTVTGIDLRRRAAAEVIAPGGRVGAVAAAGGALWTVDVRRHQLLELRPGYAAVVRRVRLPPPPPAGPVLEGPQGPWALAAGEGAVWVTDGSTRVTRVDTRTGRGRRIDLQSRLNDVTVFGGAVWLLSGRSASVLRLDSHGRRPPVRIAIAGRRGVDVPYPISVAAGLGAVWVLNGNTATVTRIDPRQLAPTATVRIGVERYPQRLAVGAGAVWVANGDGTLARIDPGGGTPRILPVAHGLNDLTVAGGAVWVTATQGAGAPPAEPAAASGRRSTVRPLATSSCSPVSQRPGDNPRLLIASSLPLQGPNAVAAVPMSEAIRQTLRDRGFRAGRHAIAFQACDDSVADPQSLGIGKCRANARMYARNPSLVGVVGPLNSGCALAALPILNGAREPVALISPSNTYIGLTRGGPGTRPSEPERYAARGVRSYARVIPSDDVQAAADATLARRLGSGRVFVLRESHAYGVGIAASFTVAARRLGIEVAGVADWTSVERAVRRVRAARPDTVFLAGTIDSASSRVLRALRRMLPARTRFVAPDGFAFDDAIKILGSASDGMYVSVAGLPTERLPRRGRRFMRRLTRAVGGRPDPYSIYAAQATEVLLDAIARSDGTRASVRREIFRTRVRHGLIGNFTITPSGDTTERSVSVYRITDGEMRLSDVIRTPDDLLRGG